VQALRRSGHVQLFRDDLKVAQPPQMNIHAKRL